MELRQITESLTDAQKFWYNEAIKEAILGQIPEDNDVQITQIANQAKSI
jgi:hypothetical protein